jgi:uncharacterized membrane protein YraQ (UPF0718 family)
MLMELGMGKGAAIALLLAGPGISLPNMLAIAKLFLEFAGQRFTSLL